MPKTIAIAEDDLHSSSRSGRAIAATTGLLLRSPRDAIAIVIAAGAVSAILINALAMQTGRHPSPMFGAASQFVPLPSPRPRTADDARTMQDQRMAGRVGDGSRLAEPRASEARDPLPPPAKTVSPLASTPVAPSVARPPAPIPVAARKDPLGDMIVANRRTAAVQRVLTEFGYGQLKPTGVAGTDTQAAITKFEKERRLPPTGQVSDRLVRELAAVTGRPIE